MKTVEELKNIFHVKDDQDLAAIFNRSPGAVSKWRATGVPASIERKATELMQARGIVSEKPEPYSPEITEIMEIFKNYPLIKATMLKMAAMSEDEQFEFYKEIRDAEKSRRGGDKPAPYVD